MKIRSQKFGAGETGQATVEAVLVTVISFLVISGLVYQLHSGFRDFADNYFGTYLVCLLETGELPAIGGGSEEGGCGRALSYELGEAGPGLAGGGGAGGGGGGGGGGAGGAPGTTTPGGASGDRSGQAVTEVGSDPSTSTWVRTSGAGQAAGSGASGRDAEGGEEASSGTSAQGSGAGGGSTEAASGTYSRSIVRDPRSAESSGIGLSRTTQTYRTTQDQAAGDGGSALRPLMVTEDQNQLRATKLSFDPRTLASETEVPEETPFTLGSYLRFLLIFAVLILIFILVGSQVLQIAKSRER